MKHILLAIFYTLSINMYSQCDTTIHKPILNFIKNTDKGFFLSMGFVMLPATGMLLLSDDRPSKYIYGTVSVVGNIALIIGAKKAFKEDHKLRNHFWHYIFMSVGGVADGISEELLHHYPLVKEKFPNMKDQFFDPSISWNNKYKNGDEKQGDAFLGSSTIFVAGTDAYHAFRAFKQTMWLGGLITFQKGKNVFYTVIEGVISIFVYTTAKGLTHYGLSH